jgi:hypothetical protein
LRVSISADDEQCQDKLKRAIPNFVMDSLLRRVNVKIMLVS